MRLSLANLATSISRDKLLSLGTCLGRSLCNLDQRWRFNVTQASSASQANFVCTSHLSLFLQNTHVIDYGSKITEKCRSYTAAILSKHMSGDGRKIALNIKAWWFTVLMILHWGLELPQEVRRRQGDWTPRVLLALGKRIVGST